MTDPERKRKIIGKNSSKFPGRDQSRGQGEISRPRHALSRRDRIRAHRRQSRGAHQEPPQRRRPAEEHEVQAGRAAEMSLQGRSASARRRTGLPKEIVWRQPFPGPGLAVRILGEVTPARCEILRNADAIVVEEMKASRLVLQNLAELRRAAARAQRGRDGRRTHLRIHHRHPRRGIAGRHDRRLGEAALRSAGKTRQPHHQRSERREPLRLRHHQQAARLSGNKGAAQLAAELLRKNE